MTRSQTMAWGAISLLIGDVCILITTLRVFEASADVMIRVCSVILIATVVSRFMSEVVDEKIKSRRSRNSDSDT